jgi:anti-sigma B factor antagonist
MPNSGLFIAHDDVDGTVVLVAHGFVDLSTRLKLSTALNDAVTGADGPVVLDLCGLDFVDSTGLGVLMNALRRLTRQRRELRLVCPPGNVRRVFEVTGLDSAFTLQDSRAEALESLPGAAPQA